MTNYEEALERFKKQGIDVSDKIILVGNSINGEQISGYSISEDKRWICIPIYDEEWSDFTGGYEYKPECYEIDEMYEAYFGNEMLRLTNIIILKKQ